MPSPDAAAAAGPGRDSIPASPPTEQKPGGASCVWHRPLCSAAPSHARALLSSASERDGSPAVRGGERLAARAPVLAGRHSLPLPAAPADEPPPPAAPASVPAEPAEEGEEEEEEEKCGFCRFMKAGPCRDVFVVRPLPLVLILHPARTDTTPPSPHVLCLTHTGVGEVRGPEQGGGWRLRGGLSAVHPGPEAVHGGEPGVLRPAPGAHSRSVDGFHDGRTSLTPKTHRMAAKGTARGSMRMQRSSHRRMKPQRKRQRLLHQRRRMPSPARWVRRPRPQLREAPCPQLPPRTRPPVV